MRGNIKRADICYIASGEDCVGSEQKGSRPALIIQNDVGNKYSTTVIVALITRNITREGFPTHVNISKKESKLTSKSVIMLEQIRTIDKKRILRKVSSLSNEKMKEVDKALAISLGMVK